MRPLKYEKMSPEELARKIVLEPGPMGADDHDYKKEMEQYWSELLVQMYAEAKKIFVRSARKNGQPLNAVGMVGELDFSGATVWDACNDSLKYFAKNHERYTFLSTFRMKYRCLLNEEFAETLEAEDPIDAKMRKKAIRKELRILTDKAQAEGRLTADIKIVKQKLKDVSELSSKSVHNYMSNWLHSSPEEIFHFDEKVFSYHFTASMDQESEYDTSSAQNRILAEAAKQTEETMKRDGCQDGARLVADKVLEITYQDAQKRKRKAPERMSGYWTVRFVQGVVGDNFAKRKEKYIYLVFYRDHKELWRKDDDDKLNGLMAVKLDIAADTWRKNRNDIAKYVWKVINDQHLFREVKA